MSNPADLALTMWGQVWRRYSEMMQATNWANLKQATVLYCEAMDQYYDAHGIQFADESLAYDNRRRGILRG